jgi:hypothetical protein
MMKMLFSPRSERSEAVGGLVTASVTATADAANQLTQTIREMLDENDRITGRRRNADKPHQ